MYFFSAFIGFAFCKIVLFFGLDVKYKLFRFANEWHYLFSGKILRLENPTKNGFNNKLQVKHLYLDVLVNEGDKNTLYTGFFGDYDLSHKDYNKLEKLHLIHPNRYKNIENQKIKKSIPGSIFTILGDKIININSTYVYQNEEEIASNKFKYKKLFFRSIQLIALFIFCFFTFILTFSIEVPVNSFFSNLLSQTIFVKILFLFTINVSTGLITPFIINNKSKRIEFVNRKDFIKLLLLNVFVVIVTYFLWGVSHDIIKNFFRILFLFIS